MNTQKASSFRWLWWLVLVMLLAWGIWLVRPTGAPQASIPYSVFVGEVRAGNVESVVISGEQISGTFREPLLWPRQQAATGTAVQANTDLTARTYADFRTTFPSVIGDPGLMAMLEQSGVQIEVTAPSGSWFLSLLTFALPIVIFGLLLVWLGRRAVPNQTGMFDFMRSRARRYASDRSDITFEDVAGAQEAKADLQQVVDFLRYPKKYHDIGARIPRGVLLVGPPGTGKTLMGRAVAGEAGVPFFHISASEFVEMFVGVGASRVRDLFQKAKESAPAIVFMDELDAVGRRRGASIGNVNDEREQTLNQLLVEMDGFEERQDVIVMAATNRPDVLDPALLRPGRFDRQVVIGLPDRTGREAILKVHARALHLAGDVDLASIARATTGMSGADLANLCNEAALIAARLGEREVQRVHFEEALDKARLGETRSLLLDEHERRLIAYHESGHAVLAWSLEKAEPVQKVTIIPRGRTLGATQQVPGEDQYNYGRDYLLARLAVMLAGRAAETVVFGDATTGAEADLVEASSLARRMVARWAMGNLGPVSFEPQDEQGVQTYDQGQVRVYSEETAARIDREVERLLGERLEFARDYLSGERAKLDTLVQALLQQETVEHDDLARILGPRPAAATSESLPEPVAIAPVA